MTARIVTTTYRYKPPPKRMGRKLAEITGPTVVTVKGSRRPVGVGETAAESEESARSERTGDTKPSTPSGKVPAPANDDRKSAIVTAQKPSSWHSDVPDMTEEEHRRRGDAADALFREMKLRIAGALPPKKP